MEEMDIVSMEPMILGFGRMGKVLCKKLQGLDVNVYVGARKLRTLLGLNLWVYTS